MLYNEFKYNITEQISNSHTILELMIFFLLYEYVIKRYICNAILIVSSFTDLFIKHGQDI